MTVLTAAEAPSPSEWQRLAERYPENPFYTPQFIEGYGGGSLRPILLESVGASADYTACPAFLKKGKLTKQLIIHSVPDVHDAAAFWPALVQFCLSKHVSELELHTFGSSPVSIPDLGHVLWRRRRVEFVLDLDADLSGSLSANHRRNASKAERSGIVIRASRAQEASRVHARLMGESLARREGPGERQALEIEEDCARCSRLVSTGAGTLFQAVFGDEVLSSLCVLRAKYGAYYHSAGSSKKGTEVGSSHLLVRTVATSLKQEGVVRFNLGGAEGEGLKRFKAGFGARAVELESAGFFVGGRLHRKLIGLVRALRDNVKRMPRHVVDDAGH